MPKFSPGSRVWYIPDHAEDFNHKDSEPGKVKDTKLVTRKFPEGGYGEVVAYMVKYDSSPDAKLTYERNLESRSLNS